MLDLRVLGVEFLQFDGKFLSGVDVDGVEDFTEWTLREFFYDFVFFAN